MSISVKTAEDRCVIKTLLQWAGQCFGDMRQGGECAYQKGGRWVRDQDSTLSGFTYAKGLRPTAGFL
ncbi:MAG: hypothetical protein PVH12_02690, partial [Candidatus Bathyarchaeota archaeon]